MQFVTIMVSISLSTFILSGAIQWYQIMQKKHQQQKIVVQALDDMHVTLQFLQRDIRNAGYRGCRSRDESFPLYPVYYQNETPYHFFHFDKSIHVFKATPGSCINQLPDEACKRLKENSMVLILYNIPKKINRLKAAMSDPTSDLSIEGKSEIWNNSLTLISDCKQGDLFIATQVISNQGLNSIVQHENIALKNESSSLSKAYGVGSEVSELQTLAYYVGTSKLENKTKSAHPLYALFRHDFIHRADEIVSDIDYLGIELGCLDPKTDAIHYKEADSLNEASWKSVKTVRITLRDIHHRIWNYEIALRNGNGFNTGYYSVDRYFLTDGSYV